MAKNEDKHPQYWLGHVLPEARHRRCAERGLPPLDSLVVHVAGNSAASQAPATSASTDNPTRSARRPHRSAPPRQLGSGRRRWTSVVLGVSAAAEDKRRCGDFIRICIVLFGEGACAT
jgi:hypothetical protein